MSSPAPIEITISSANKTIGKTQPIIINKYALSRFLIKATILPPIKNAPPGAVIERTYSHVPNTAHYIFTVFAINLASFFNINSSSPRSCFKEPFWPLVYIYIITHKIVNSVRHRKSNNLTLNNVWLI